jgi:hypothetical protein
MSSGIAVHSNRTASQGQPPLNGNAGGFNLGIEMLR